MTNWEQDYQPPQKSVWQGREDSTRIYQKVKCAHVNDSLQERSVAILGYCQDEGVKRNLGRVGAKEGPTSFRKALANLALHRQDLSLLDVGNLNGIADLESSQLALGEMVDRLQKSKVLPLIIGGGHETAWGHFQGLIKQPFVDDIAIINIDAHFDLREEPQSTSGTPFLQIHEACRQANKAFNYYVFGVQEQANTDRLFERAKQLKVQYRTAGEIWSDPKLLDRELQSILSKHKYVYLTICLDAFSVAYAPGVSATSVGGLNPWHVIPMIQKLAKSGQVKSLDIVELAPKYDIDHRTAKLAATLTSHFIENLQWANA